MRPSEIPTDYEFFRSYALITPGLQELVASPEMFGCFVIYEVFDSF